MDRLCCTDSGEVTITLVGEDHLVGVESLDSRGEGWSTSVCSLLPVYVDELVGEDGAAHRSDADRRFLQSHLCYRLSD